MAKHHPDLIMCRKQPGVGKENIPKLSNPSKFYTFSSVQYELFLFSLQPLVDSVKNVSWNYLHVWQVGLTKQIMVKSYLQMTCLSLQTMVFV